MARGVYKTIVGRGGGGHGSGGHGGHGHAHHGFHGHGGWGGWGGWGWGPWWGGWGWGGYALPDGYQYADVDTVDDGVLPHWQSPRFYAHRHRRRVHALLGAEI